VVPEVEELTQGDPETVAIENARRKAKAVASGASEAAVLGVDTLVRLGARIYGKPADEDAARATLGALSGQTHTVISGVCLIRGGTSQTPAGASRTAVAATRVEFRALDAGLIEWYLASQEWRERAGGYAIQGRGAALVRRIEGDYLNVVGLPVASLLDLAPWLLERSAV
jgi:septum formation protein